MSESDIPSGRQPEPLPAAVQTDWRRLHPKMLLVHPINELIQFFPAVIGAFVFGDVASDSWWVQAVAIAAPILLGLARYVTTFYRIGDAQVEVKRGLISRKILTAPLERVRSVELTSPLIHRLLGLTKVQVGTGSGGSGLGSEQVELDSLAVADARQLRQSLLHRRSGGVVGFEARSQSDTRTSTTEGAGPQSDTRTSTTEGAGPQSDAGTSTTGEAGTSPTEGTRPQSDTNTDLETPLHPQPDQAFLRLIPSWAKYAPLTSSGLGIAGLGLAFIVQFLGGVTIDGDFLGLGRQPAWILGVLGVVALVSFAALCAVLAIAGYLVANWDLTVSRDRLGRSFQVTRGLFTTRETSLDVARVHGVRLKEPLGLRFAGAGEVHAIATGIGTLSDTSATLVPPAPLDVAEGVGHLVLGETDTLRTPLTGHGPRATRRRWIRGFVGAMVVSTIWSAAVWLFELPVVLHAAALLFLLAQAWLARDRARRLGHALTDRYVLFRSGSALGHRTALSRDGIIGWNLDQTWFQRRVGLVTLTATTSAGDQHYGVYDVPEGEAVRFADEATPGLLSEFVTR